MLNTLHLRSALVVGASAVALSSVASPAWSQNVIQELVVTAQKREEALQDVPIAVSAFNQDTLEKAKIDGGPNLVIAVPNVNFSKGNFTGYNFQIRGIGSKLVAGSGDAEAEPVFDGERSTLPSSRVMPGKSLKWRQVFGQPGSDIAVTADWNFQGPVTFQ